jgi:hypothetical protein
MIDKATLSLDVSTSTIGLSLFDKDGNLAEMDYINFLKNKDQDLFEKADLFQAKVQHMLNCGITNIAIEEPLMKLKGKYSNAATIALLNCFNGIISDRCYRLFNVKPVYYNVNHARRSVFDDLPKKSEEKTIKHEVWNRVCKMEPQINWIYGPKSRKLIDENYDMCDSYVIGVCHLLNINQQENMLALK